MQRDPWLLGMGIVVLGKTSKKCIKWNCWCHGAIAFCSKWEPKCSVLMRLVCLWGPWQNLNHHANASKPNFYYSLTWPDTHAQAHLINSYVNLLIVKRWEKREFFFNISFFFLKKKGKLNIKFEIIIRDHLVLILTVIIQ